MFQAFDGMGRDNGGCFLFHNKPVDRHYYIISQIHPLLSSSGQYFSRSSAFAASPLAMIARSPAVY